MLAIHEHAKSFASEGRARAFLNTRGQNLLALTRCIVLSSLLCRLPALSCCLFRADRAEESFFASPCGCFFLPSLMNVVRFRCHCQVCCRPLSPSCPSCRCARGAFRHLHLRCCCSCCTDSTDNEQSDIYPGRNQHLYGPDIRYPSLILFVPLVAAIWAETAPNRTFLHCSHVPVSMARSSGVSWGQGLDLDRTSCRTSRPPLSLSATLCLRQRGQTRSAKLSVCRDISNPSRPVPPTKNNVLRHSGMFSCRRSRVEHQLTRQHSNLKALSDNQAPCLRRLG